MIFEQFIKEKVEYVADDYKILNKEITNKYDIQLIKLKMNKMIETIKEAQYRFFNFEIPDITYNYKNNYQKYNNGIKDSTYSLIAEKIQTEEELSNTYIKMKNIFDNSFSYAEKVVFINVCIAKKNREFVKEKLKIGSEKYTLIRNSCFIKFALGFNFKDIEK